MSLICLVHCTSVSLICYGNRAVFDGQRCVIQFLINKAVNAFRIIWTISISNGTSYLSCKFTESQNQGIKPAYCSIQYENEDEKTKELRRAYLINLVSFKDFIIVSVMLNCKWWLAVRQCSFCYEFFSFSNNRVLFQQFHNYGLSFFFSLFYCCCCCCIPHVKWTSLKQQRFNWCRAFFHS